MKKFFKIIGIIIGSIILLIGIVIGYISIAYPKYDPAPDITVSTDSVTIERGRYLAVHVTGCMYCHSEINTNNFGWIYNEGTEGAGYNWKKIMDRTGEEFPGIIRSSNITPFNLGEWTDGEIHRAITAGVDNEGNALFPMMPYENFRKMADEDVNAIIAYLRTLNPIERNWPRSEMIFPMALMIKMAPKPYEHVDAPDKSNSVEYGEYLVNISNCLTCHSQVSGMKFEPIKGLEFAGGFEFPQATGGITRSANITPDEETGIKSWSKEKFVQKFKEYEDKPFNQKVPEGAFNSNMPWKLFAGMTEEDLGAIYDYLRTVPAVENAVEKFTPPE